MKHYRSALLLCLFLTSSASAGDPPFLPRFQSLEKSPGIKLLRALGSGELPPLFTRASAISEDGKTAAYVDYVGGGENKVPRTRLLLWDIASGRFRKEIPVAGQVLALRLSSDASRGLVSIMTGDDKKVVFSVSEWDLTLGKQLHALGTHKNFILTLAYSPKNNQALSVDVNQIKVWNLTKGILQREIGLGDDMDFFAAAYLPDGKKILCAVNHNLRLIDLEAVDPKKAAAGVLELTGHQQPIIDLAISPDGKTAVSTGRDETVRSWDLVKGKALHVHKKTVPLAWISMGFSDDGKTVLACWNDDANNGAAILSLWDASTGKELWSRNGNYRGTVPIRVRGTQALIGGGCNVLTQWDLAKGTIERTWGGHKSPVTALCADAQGRLYSAGQDGYVHIWEKDQIVRSIPAHTEPIHALLLNAKETHMFTVSADKTVKVWELATGKLQQTLAGHEGAVMALTFTKDGKRAYTASGDRTVKLWDLETGKVLATFAGHSEGVNAVVLSADENWLASGSDDATIRIWPLKDGKHDTDRDDILLEQHKKAVTCLALSPDGKTLLSGSQDQTVKVWDWSKGKLVRSIPGHKNWVTSLLVLDAKTLLTTSDDLSLCCWDFTTGKELTQIDFGVIGDCPRCLTRRGTNRIATGTSSWMIFEFELADRKTKGTQGSSEE